MGNYLNLSEKISQLNCCLGMWEFHCDSVPKTPNTGNMVSMKFPILSCWQEAIISTSDGMIYWRVYDSERWSSETGVCSDNKTHFPVATWEILTPLTQLDCFSHCAFHLYGPDKDICRVHYNQTPLCMVRKGYGLSINVNTQEHYKHRYLCKESLWYFCQRYCHCK